MDKTQELFEGLPSVDEVLKSGYGIKWLGEHPRLYVLSGIREVIDLRRQEILAGTIADVSPENMARNIEATIERLAAFSLKPVINATGIVLHTNLGRSVLSEKALENIIRVAGGYSNLEYDLAAGKRGQRFSHITRLLREITGAEGGIAVNNNAAAVFLCLNALAKGKEVIVSRGELVEIGGSFRIPDVMVSSGAILREVGTTNKTHLYDYENAINENTALILKVHQSNYRMSGFTEDVSIDSLVSLGKKRDIPVMYDLGSGCLIDLKPYGLYSEPSVQEIVRSGADIVTFSGDKLLGGPQAGLIVGRQNFIERVKGNPVARAVRIDKLTLSALEATLFEYVDNEKAKDAIPVLRMLLEDIESIKTRTKKIAGLIKRHVKNASIEIMADSSQAGGGALPGKDFPTYTVSVRPEHISVNELEERLRKGDPPVIARVREGALLLDVRTISDKDAVIVADRVRTALS